MDHDLQLKHPISDDYYSSNHHGHALLLSLFSVFAHKTLPGLHPFSPPVNVAQVYRYPFFIKRPRFAFRWSSSKLKGKITVWFFLRRVNQKEALLGFSLLSFQFSVATTSNKMSFSLAQASRSEFPRSLFPFRFLNFLFDDVWCCFPFTASSKSQPSFRSLFFSFFLF